MQDHYTFENNGRHLPRFTVTEADRALSWVAGDHFDFAELLAHFAPISLAVMDRVTLLKRTDTKYLLSEGQLFDILGSLIGQYWVLEINQVRLNHYRTLYYDTADFALYLRHRAGAYNRYKVRSREYLDS